MKRIACLVAVIYCIALSCTKSNSVPEPLPPDPSDTTIVPKGNGLLRKQWSSQLPTDSIVSDFSYDAAGRLVMMTNASYFYGGPSPVFSRGVIRYYRDSNGRLVSTASKADNEPDSSHTYYFYTGPGTPVISHTLRIENLHGNTGYDSTVFEYDATGHITRRQGYYTNNWPAKPPAKAGYFDLHEYEPNGNPLKWETHMLYAGTPVKDSLITRILYTYGDKKNAFIQDELGLSGPSVFKNNMTSQHILFAKGLAGGYDENTITYTYSFDANNRPVTSKSVAQNTPTDTLYSRYYYND